MIADEREGEVSEDAQVRSRAESSEDSLYRSRSVHYVLATLLHHITAQRLLQLGKFWPFHFILHQLSNYPLTHPV